MSDDRSQIIDMLNRYVHVADWLNTGTGVDGSMADFFTEDGVFEFAGRAYDGVEAIEQMFGADEMKDSVHMAFNPVVDIQQGAATAVSKFTLANARSGQTLYGDYRDELRATPDGWRIGRRV